MPLAPIVSSGSPDVGAAVPDAEAVGGVLLRPANCPCQIYHKEMCWKEFTFEIRARVSGSREAIGGIDGAAAGLPLAALRLPKAKFCAGLGALI